MLKDVARLRGVNDVEKANEQRRRSLGIYYTPPSAAQVLARWAIQRRSDTVLEPSFGGCALLEAAVDRLSELGSSQPSAQLSGYDIDLGAFSHLNRLLSHHVSHEGQFLHADFLVADPDRAKQASAIIANPPFVSWHRMNGEQRDVVKRWRDRYEPQFPKTASLWAYFLIHATLFLAPRGRLAFVLPASAVTADYGRSVLDAVARRFLRVHLFRLNEQLFIQAGAQERTVLVLGEDFQPARTAAGALCNHRVSSLSELEGTIARLGTRGDSHSHRDGSTDMAMGELDSLIHGGNICELGAVARVAIGEVVGDTPFFVKTASEWEALGMDPRRFVPLLTGMRQASGLRVTSRDISSSYSAIPRLLKAPTGRLPRQIDRYLKSYAAVARRRNVTFAKREPWHAVSYDNGANAFIGSISHDAPRVLLNSARISCANGLYKLSTCNGIKWHPGLAVASLSTVTQLAAEYLARALGSGGLKLEPSDVRKLSLPDSYCRLSTAETGELVGRVDALLRAGERNAANRLVDERLLVAPGLLTPQRLRDLRNQLAELRYVRMRKTA